jgi:hypothetical protein
MRAELATTMDVPSWSEIVREVEPLFGSTPDFERLDRVRNLAASGYVGTGLSGSGLGLVMRGS